MILLCFTLDSSLTAAPGNVDTSFNAGSIGGDIWAISLQPDGKIYVGGTFTNFNGTGRNLIARLLPSGEIDTNFIPETAMYINPPDPYFYVETLAVQSDGKVLIGGGFSNYTNYSASPVSLARLDTNGTLDPTFRPAIGDSIYSLALQPDGKILVGGYFARANGLPRASIARLNTDGTTDVTFNPGTGANSAVLSIALQADKKVLIGGVFTSINGTNHPYLARLNEDGSLDTTFNGRADDRVYSIAVEPDGNILLGGWFGNVNFINAHGFARLDSAGNLLDTFTSGTANPGGGQGRVYSVLPTPNGKILLGGTFKYMNGANRSGIARLNHDGTLDASFDPGLGIANGVNPAVVFCLGVQADNEVLLGGRFSTIDGVLRPSLARLWADPTAIPLGVQRSNGSLILSWSNPAFSLESSFSPTGAFTTVTGATSPYTTIFVGPEQYFRLKAN